MALSDYDEHVFRLGELTLNQLKQHNLPPTAENYTVWLTAMQGFVRDLASEIRQLKQRDGPIDPQELASLYQRHILEVREAGDEKLADVSAAIQATSESLRQASQGAKDYGGTLDAATHRMKRLDKEELEQLVGELVAETSKMRSSTVNLQEDLASRQTEIERLRAELDIARRASDVDELTGIGNRRAFEYALRKSIDEATQSANPLSLLMIDVDHFKKFNDTYGHQIGDIVLRLIAGLLKQQIKGKDTVARYGGEEFAIVLPETEMKGAVSLAEHICKGVARQRPRIKSSQKELEPITLSIGVSLWRAGDSTQEFVGRADSALYLAKSAGRNGVRTEVDIDEELEIGELTMEGASA